MRGCGRGPEEHQEAHPGFRSPRERRHRARWGRAQEERGGQEADASDNGSVSWARKKNAFQVLGTRLASGRLMLSHVISFLHQVIASVLHMSDVSREGTCVNRSRRSMRTEAHLGSAHSTHPPRACCM